MILKSKSHSSVQNQNRFSRFENHKIKITTENRYWTLISIRPKESDISNVSVTFVVFNTVTILYVKEAG